MSARWVTTSDGLRLWAEERGTGAAVVIPGAALVEDDLAPLYEEFRVVLFDIRNRGRSDPVPPEGQVGYPIELDDIDSIRAAFTLDSFSLIGWSYVGMAAALYAARQPRGLERLAMVCPAPPRQYAPDERSTNYREAYLAVLAELQERFAAAPGDVTADPIEVARAFYDATTPLAMGDPTAYPRRLTDSATFPNEWPDHVRDALERVSATFNPDGYDYRPRGATVQVPTLVVHGDADRIPLAASIDWTASIPDARLLRLPGVGHFPFIEAPESYFLALSTFLRGGWPEAATKP
jgi:pimeloyl-ACP methyl ester carboxylesterase